MIWLHGQQRGLRAGKNRFTPPRIRFVRDITGSVRTQFVPCGHFPVRAAKNRSVRAPGRSVRANFLSVRAKIDLCGQKPICAGFALKTINLMATKRRKRHKNERFDEVLCFLSLFVAIPGRLGF
jgi:hypothetical protein